MLLLDEPSSGIAQRETEALGPVLLDIRDQTGAALVVIEHDMPLITAISDELVALELGRSSPAANRRRGHQRPGRRRGLPRIVRGRDQRGPAGGADRRAAPTAASGPEGEEAAKKSGEASSAGGKPRSPR